MPMLIEKLESDIPSARLSAMDVFVNNQFCFFRKRKNL
jgi:hypothetical protein